MLVPAPMDDFEELRISGEEVTADGEEIAELELEVEPEDVLNSCNLMRKLE